MLGEIAGGFGVSVGRVVLRRHVQHDVVPIPKSKHPERQRENLDMFFFELADAQMAAIDALDCGRMSQNPDEHEEF